MVLGGNIYIISLSYLWQIYQHGCFSLQASGKSVSVFFARLLLSLLLTLTPPPCALTTHSTTRHSAPAPSSMSMWPSHYISKQYSLLSDHCTSSWHLDSLCFTFHSFLASLLVILYTEIKQTYNFKYKFYNMKIDYNYLLRKLRIYSIGFNITCLTVKFMKHCLWLLWPKKHLL